MSLNIVDSIRCQQVGLPLCVLLSQLAVLARGLHLGSSSSLRSHGEVPRVHVLRALPAKLAKLCATTSPAALVRNTATVLVHWRRSRLVKRIIALTHDLAGLLRNAFAPFTFLLLLVVAVMVVVPVFPILLLGEH